MILNHFPQTCPLPGWPNLIIDAKGRDVAYPRHAGPLSIKCVFRGREVHEVHNARFEINERGYLVLNAGQCYSSYTGPEGEAEIFTIFFNPEFAREVLRCLVTPADSLLAGAGGPCRQPVSFLERIYPHDSVVTPAIFRIRAAVRDSAASEDGIEEQLYLLLGHLLTSQRSLYRDIEKLPAVRSSTRVEIYRRLHRAKDFMDASLDQNVDLAAMAKIACLSRYHFLRLFNEAFHETPHQYLIRKRLELAQDLLLRTDRSVSDICRAVGFNSLGSFSHLFRRRHGVPPSQFRRVERASAP